VLGSIDNVNGASDNVNVGIGTDTPADPLHVRRVDGTAKVFVEEASGTFQGRELFQLTNNGAARFRLRNTSNNATWDFQSSSFAGSFVIDRVGGPTTLDFELQSDGDLVLQGTVTAGGFITSSDRSLKTDITPAKASQLMSLLRQLDISTWRFKTEPKGTVNLGPMAQDFHRLFGMGTQTTIDVRDLAALALVATQVLDEQAREHGAEQERVNAAQQKEIDELRRAMNNAR
jgi:hypothetical protein